MRAEHDVVRPFARACWPRSSLSRFRGRPRRPGFALLACWILPEGPCRFCSRLSVGYPYRPVGRLDSVLRAGPLVLAGSSRPEWALDKRKVQSPGHFAATGAFAVAWNSQSVQCVGRGPGTVLCAEFAVVALIVGAPWCLAHLSQLSTFLEVSTANPIVVAGDVPPTFSLASFTCAPARRAKLAAVSCAVRTPAREHDLDDREARALNATGRGSRFFAEQLVQHSWSSALTHSREHPLRPPSAPLRGESSQPGGSSTCHGPWHWPRSRDPCSV